MIYRVLVIAVLASIAAYQDVDMAFVIMIFGIAGVVFLEIFFNSKRKPPGK